jgi:hypothetical protein
MAPLNMSKATPKPPISFKISNLFARYSLNASTFNNCRINNASPFIVVINFIDMASKFVDREPSHIFCIFIKYEYRKAATVAPSLNPPNNLLNGLGW